MTLRQRHLIDDAHRVVHTAQLFGVHFPLRLEPVVYAFAERLSPDYKGGYWHFYRLSNGGFYLAPAEDKGFRVSCDNGHEGRLSADAFGITVCLYAYSHLSFGTPSRFSASCAEHYHWLRDYALGHTEVGAILAAID